MKNMERVGHLTPDKVSKMGVDNPYLNTLIAEEDSYPSEATGPTNIPSPMELKSLRGYLRGPRRSIFWQLTVSMETEEACTLAVRYTESRRNEILSEKMRKLKTLLGNWQKFPWGNTESIGDSAV
jgi:hypothetical protein